jgi:hypothetical protein
MTYLHHTSQFMCCECPLSHICVEYLKADSSAHVTPGVSGLLRSPHSPQGVSNHLYRSPLFIILIIWMCIALNCTWCGLTSFHVGLKGSWCTVTLNRLLIFWSQPCSLRCLVCNVQVHANTYIGYDTRSMCAMFRCMPPSLLC